MKRNLLILFAVCLGSALGCGTRRPPNTFRQKLVTLGLDGLDPRFVRRWMIAGKLPNPTKLADRGGGMHTLETTRSPDSPTTWGRPVNAGSHTRIIAISPTVLKYFGVPIPGDIDVQPLF